MMIGHPRRGSGRVAMSWLPAWLLACALTAATPAMAQPAPTPEPTGEQVKAFLENRSDPVVGAWVARKLQPDGAASTAPPALDATVGQDTAQGEVAGYLDARLRSSTAISSTSARPCRPCRPNSRPLRGG